MLFAKTETVELNIGGMHCKHCSARVEAALKATSGVKKVAVDLEKGSATVNYLPGKTSVEAMTAAVVKLGFTAEAVK